MHLEKSETEVPNVQDQVALSFLTVTLMYKTPTVCLTPHSSSLFFYSSGTQISTEVADDEYSDPSSKVLRDHESSSWMLTP